MLWFSLFLPCFNLFYLSYFSYSSYPSYPSYPSDFCPSHPYPLLVPLTRTPFSEKASPSYPFGVFLVTLFTFFTIPFLLSLPKKKTPSYLYKKKRPYPFYSLYHTLFTPSYCTPLLLNPSYLYP